MMTTRKARPWFALAAATSLVFALLGSMSTAAAADDETDADPACSIHLYDGDDFDETDDNFILTEPGEYTDLEDLPGADQDWTDEADSAKVGSEATVEVFADTGFEGDSTVLEPGSEHGSLDPEPSSLKMTCGDDEADFADVDEDNPFFDDITWLAENEITTGYDDGSFRPENGITREATAAYLYRMAGEPDVTADPDLFNDVGADNEFADAITWVEDQGISNGYDDGSYRPKNEITREAMAAFLARYADADPSGDSGSFSDIADSSFADEIVWLEDAGIANGYDNGTYRPENHITREATAAYLHRFDVNV